MGIQERRQREVEARRKSILESARQLFEIHGFEATSVDRIAEHAELSKGTVYHYFPSKQDMLGALQLERLDALLERMTEATVGQDDPTERLRALGRAYMAFVREGLPPLQAVFVGASDRKALEMSPDPQAAIVDRSRRLFKMVEDSIKEGVSQGQIFDGLDPTRLAFGMWSVVLGVHTLASIMHEVDTTPFVTEVSEELFRLIGRGLLP
jgi:AcrR family transcriptional regulator